MLFAIKVANPQAGARPSLSGLHASTARRDNYARTLARVIRFSARGYRYANLRFFVVAIPGQDVGVTACLCTACGVQLLLRADLDPYGASAGSPSISDVVATHRGGRPGGWQMVQGDVCPGRS